jgi:hypothetical protein
MSSLETIKEAIAKLPAEDQAALSSWLSAQTMDDWDREMAQDFSPGGRGAAVMERVESDLAAGNVESIEEGFARRRSSQS